MSVLYVYRGPGCSAQALGMLYNMLSEFCDARRHRVQFISPEEIVEGTWCESAALLAFGGGYDRGFAQALGDVGVAEIKQYVLSGGKYLGICAGAYFACDEVIFDKGGPLQVWEKRHLQFFKGKCIGPVFPGFQYDSELGAHRASIKWTFPHESGINLGNIHTNMYFNGGGKFEPEIIGDTKHDSQIQKNFRVLGTYDSLENAPIAAVHCIVGSGEAILSGVHFEYSASELSKTTEPQIDKIVESMKTCTIEINDVTTQLLNLLGITSNSDKADL